MHESRRELVSHIKLHHAHEEPIWGPLNEVFQHFQRLLRLNPGVEKPCNPIKSGNV
jgi:hypothetical protein